MLWVLIADEGTSRPGILERDHSRRPEGLQGEALRKPFKGLLTVCEFVGAVMRASFNIASHDCPGLCRECGRGF